MRIYEGEGARQSDSTILVNLSAITLTNDGGRGGRSNLKGQCSEGR